MILNFFSLLLMLVTTEARAVVCLGVDFDPVAYWKCNPDVKAANHEPCAHYTNHGQKEGRRWDCDANQVQKPTVGNVPAKSNCNGRPFNKSAYLICNSDVAAAGVDACAHYTNNGVAEGRKWDCDLALNSDPSGTANVPSTSTCQGKPFNVSGYLICQKDIADLEVDPCKHYTNHGIAEGRKWNCAAAGRLPGASAASGGSSNATTSTVPATENCAGDSFNSAAYLICNPDVARAGEKGCSHYTKHGKTEKRRWDCDAAKGRDYSSSTSSTSDGTTGTSSGSSTSGGTSGGTTGSSVGAVIPFTPVSSGNGYYETNPDYQPIDIDGGEAELYIQNDRVKVGVWRNHGAAITYLATPGKYNAVNNVDLGRQLQSAIYSHPVPYTIPGVEVKTEWQNVGWNPIEAGDVFANPPPVEVMAKSADGKTIYTRTRPFHWALMKAPGETIVEKWISLVGEENGVKIHYRYRVERADRSKYLARQQEFPCLYTVGSMYKFIGYFGESPFTNAPLDTIGIDDKADRGLLVYPTEAWMGLVDDENYGAGIYSADGTMRFTKNYFSPPDQPGIVKNKDTKSYHSGYISLAPMHFVENGVYEYDTYAMVGSKEEMRDFVYRRPRVETRPNFHFEIDAEGFSYGHGMGDAPGEHSQRPLKGVFTFNFKNGEGTLNAPEKFFKAEDVPTLYIKAAFKTNMPQASFVFLKTTERKGEVINPIPERTVRFDIVNDGQMRVYKINLASHPEWRGGIAAFSLFPGQWINKSYEGQISIDYISYKEH